MALNFFFTYYLFVFLVAIYSLFVWNKDRYDEWFNNDLILNKCSSNFFVGLKLLAATLTPFMLPFIVVDGIVKWATK
jgi:hypothetical protein